MDDNARTLARLNERQGIVAERLLAEEAAGAQPPISSPAPGDEPMHDPDALWARARRQQAALAQLEDHWQHAERRLRHTPSIRPATAAWLSSSFGVRHDPMSRNLIMHKGLDLAGFVGLVVRAPADGTVIWAGTRGGYGQTVVIDHGWGVQTHFAHLSKYLVQPGARVTRGVPIAEMGSTGKSTGPHLHYEVRLDGYPINPIKFILD